MSILARTERTKMHSTNTFNHLVLLLWSLIVVAMIRVAILDPSSLLHVVLVPLLSPNLLEVL